MGEASDTNPDWKPLISVPFGPAPTHLEKIWRTAYFDPHFLLVDRAGDETKGFLKDYGQRVLIFRTYPF